MIYREDFNQVRTNTIFKVNGKEWPVHKSSFRYAHDIVSFEDPVDISTPVEYGWVLAKVLMSTGSSKDTIDLWTGHQISGICLSTVSNSPPFGRP